ncbi:hypothetical protein [Candidatus Spongiihabitans sp.]|uniref:hypothetical protein n=1 Tax=Candidatus Spongiihabitans sp. TaxID=3101308 RepID=UPI003C6FAA42
MTILSYAKFITIILFLCGIISPRTYAETHAINAVKIALPSWEGGQKYKQNGLPIDKAAEYLQ